jgi:predicted phage tail protein
MKATFDIPDALYRRVKVRSAMEGMPVRAVAVELFRKWLEAPDLFTSKEKGAVINREDAAPWLAVTKPHLRPGMSHDLDAIRTAAEKGWKDEVSGKEKSRMGRNP